MIFPNRGLYAITQPEHKSVEKILTEVEAVISGGAVVVQYRDKRPIDGFFLAQELVNLCHSHQVPLIINDDIDLAIKVGADGVHLGQSDGNMLKARHRLGTDAIIGVSCYNSMELALSAQMHGASYVAFGRFFASSSKPLAAPAQLSTLHLAKEHMTIPIVAIGGILPDNGAGLLQAGADLLAVIGGLYNDNPKAAAQAYQQLF